MDIFAEPSYTYTPGERREAILALRSLELRAKQLSLQIDLFGSAMDSRYKMALLPSGRRVPATRVNEASSLRLDSA
jgi:hypothetical protein